MIKFHLSLTFRNVNVILVRTLAALESMQINIWHQNDSICEKGEKILFELFDPKNYIIPIGVTPNGKKFFFSILGIRMAQFAKRKQKNISNILTQKNSITPAGMTSNGQKSPKKFFLHFWHQNDSIREKKQKKNFDPKFGPGMCGM